MPDCSGALVCKAMATGFISDESRFTLQKADGRTRVYRRRGEKYANPCVVEVGVSDGVGQYFARW